MTDKEILEVLKDVRSTAGWIPFAFVLCDKLDSAITALESRKPSQHMIIDQEVLKKEIADQWAHTIHCSTSEQAAKKMLPWLLDVIRQSNQPSDLREPKPIERSWNCFPGRGQHEVGCPHKEWPEAKPSASVEQEAREWAELYISVDPNIPWNYQFAEHLSVKAYLAGHASGAAEGRELAGMVLIKIEHWKSIGKHRINIRSDQEFLEIEAAAKHYIEGK